jgi:uncharacterized protein YkwD
MLSASSRHVLLLAATLALVCVASLVTARGAAAARVCGSANATPATAGERQLLRATLCLLNAHRAAARLAPLRLERKLSKAADAHVRDMARRRYFAHDSLDGATFLDRIRAAGYLKHAAVWAAGENIAWGSGARSTPRSITKAWMGSPDHRANILSSTFRDIGIGVAAVAPVAGVGGPAATYATDFGSRG